MTTIKKFNQNLLIQRLANQPYWSVSLDFHQNDSGQKVPMHWLKWHEQHLIRMYNLKDSTTDQYPYDALTILSNIDADPTFDTSNRTYRLNATDTHIIMIDIEPNANPTTVEKLTHLPCGYVERSQHGGYHVLIEMDDIIANSFSDVLAKSVIKGPIDSTKAFDDPENKPQFEVLLNNHFITFTRNVLPFNTDGNKGNNMILRRNLIQFLVKCRGWMPDETVSNDEGISQINLKKQIDIDKDDKPTQALIKLINNDSSRVGKRITSIFNETKLSDSDNDYSRYEYRLACRVASALDYYQSQYKRVDGISDYNLINVIGYVLTDHLDPNKRTRHKNKYATTRNGVPYLLSISKNALSYIRSHQ